MPTPVTDNLNALRVRPATTTTQRCDEFHVRTDPESRLGRHVDYFGTEVIEFGISQPHSSLTIDVRARVVTSEAVRAAGRLRGTHSRRRPTARRPGSTCWRASPSRPTARSRSCEQASRATGPLATAERGLHADPRALRVPPWRHLRRLDRRRPARGRRRRLPGLRPSRADPAAPARRRGALRLGLSLRRAARRRRRLDRGRHARLARGAAPRRRRARRAGRGSAWTRRTARVPMTAT